MGNMNKRLSSLNFFINKNTTKRKNKKQNFALQAKDKCSYLKNELSVRL